MTPGPSRSVVDEQVADPGDAAALVRILDALAVGLIYRVGDSRRVITNAAAKRILGLVAGNVSAEVVMARLTQFAGPALANPETKNRQVEHNGRRYQIGSRTIQEGSGSGLLWLIDDVTDDLQRRSQLTQAKRRALVAYVAGGVGHQLNNILARIICRAETIQDATSLNQASDLAEDLIGMTEAGAQTVRRLMTYAQGSGVDCTEINLAALLNDWWAGVSGSVTIDMVDCEATVIADRELLCATLDELYANAVHGSATTLRLRCSDAANDMICLTATDDGRGMTPTVCGGATDPVFTSSVAGEAAGMDLSLVLEAVRQCAGELEVVSYPGKGMTVRLTLARGKKGQT